MLRSCRHVSILFLMLALLCAAGCSKSEETALFLHEKGHVLLNQGKHLEALEAYQQASLKDPSNPTILYDIGVVYGELDQYNKALDAYTKSIEIDPRNPRSLNNRGVAYFQLRQFKKSVDDCTRSIEFDPTETMAFRNRGLAYQELGELELALADFNAAVRLGPQVPEGFFARASLYQEQHQYQLALQDCEEGLRLVPRSAQGHLQRGLAQRGLGKTDLAERDFKKAQEIDPEIKIPQPVIAAKPVGPAPVSAAAPAEAKLRAEEIAKSYLAEHGYTEIQRTGSDSPCELTAKTKAGPIEIDVQIAAENSTCRVSRSELLRLREHKSPMHMVIVGELDLTKSGSGRVLGLQTAWPPQDDQLVPFEYEVRDATQDKK